MGATIKYFNKKMSQFREGLIEADESLNPVCNGLGLESDSETRYVSETGETMELNWTNTECSIVVWIGSGFRFIALML